MNGLIVALPILVLLVLVSACTTPSGNSGGMQTSMKYEMPAQGVITFQQ